MCLAVPGKILEVDDQVAGPPMGVVSFGGIRKQICLAYVPEAVVGDYVLAHVGFALNVIDEKEAQEVFKLLEEMGELAENELSPDEPPGEAP
jgi:hydrogenase expression/formation protein HypC